MHPPAPATFFSWLKTPDHKESAMHDTPPNELEPIVERLLEQAHLFNPDVFADALAVAFARHCKDKFDAPGLERGYGYVDTVVTDKGLGEIEVRVTVFRKVPPVDRRSYASKEAT
jgi:hypothetical protein